MNCKTNTLVGRRHAAPNLVTAAALMLFGLPTWIAIAQNISQNKKPLVGQLFELQVVGPDGKPVPHVAVEIRAPLAPTTQPIKRGELVSMGGFTTAVKTDSKGEVVIEIAKDQKRFVVNIQQPGYGPYWAEWNGSEHPVEIPAKFVAELEEGWTVGGVVLDADGVPVEGATVDPNIKFKKRPGDFGDFYVGAESKTDSAGKWEYHSVPASMREVHVAINHNDFMPERRVLTRSEFGIEAQAEPSGQIELKRGVMVTGTVTDEAGNPIADAVIKSQFLNENRETTTADDGTYFLAGCEPRMTRIVVRAKGRALEMKQVRVESGMDPVDFTLHPGGKIRVRVVDENDKPLPRSRIFFQKWRGDIQYFEFDHVNDYTGADGVWKWDEAPLDEFKADICPPNGMQLQERPLVAREEEYVFRRIPLLVISGKVVDAETKEPVKNFRVVPGVRWDNQQLFWSQHESFDAAEGRFQITRNREQIAHMVRIEASGYLAGVSREIKSDEGKITLDFELKPAENVVATLTTPAGKPAVNAKVAIGIAGSQIHVTNGDIDDGSTYAARQLADENGRISIPPQEGPFHVVITHPDGFAHLKSADAPIPRSIKLTPWARLEGTFQVGTDPANNVQLDLNSESFHSYGEGQPNIFTQHKATTAKDGSFVFERALPGKGRIGRRILFMHKEGATEVTSAKMVRLELPAGETTKIKLGGDGRPVVGKLAPPPGTENAAWNFASISVQPHLKMPESPKPPEDVQNDAEKMKAWWNEWITTEIGKLWRKSSNELNILRDSQPYYSASVARDGSFRIDDMPPGNYMMNIHFYEQAPGDLGNHAFTVPDPESDKPTEAFDLGKITLEKSK